MDERQRAAARLLEAEVQLRRAQVSLWGVGDPDARDQYAAARAELEAAERAGLELLARVGPGQ